MMLRVHTIQFLTNLSDETYWQAWSDDAEVGDGPIGEGRTEAEAIDDLKAQLEGMKCQLS
jgi:hypothetical protein